MNGLQPDYSNVGSVSEIRQDKAILPEYKFKTIYNTCSLVNGGLSQTFF